MSIADHFVTESGTVQLITRTDAASRGLRTATDQEIGASMRARVSRRGAKTAGRGGGCGCGGRKRVDASAVPLVRWLGIDWIGEPWPLRLRLRWPVHARPSRGCGCVERLKRWTEARRLARFALRKNRESAT